MAAVAQPLSPATRQPFGVVGANRLRVLESMKNHQNGLTASSKKRPLESDSSDTENVDPVLIDNAAKRKRANPGSNFSKPATYKSPTFKTTVTKPTTTNQPQTPLNRPKNISIPHSAPLRAPAGRSPKAKSGAKAFARRSIGSSYTRIDPPSSPSFSNRHAPKAPFSIATALNGTFNVSSSIVKPQVQPSKPSRPKAWDFEIYADTEQDEMANLMEHSTCVLDISDDEEKAASRDDRGKENIPPPDFRQMNGNIMSSSAAQGISNSRTVEMTDGPRSALGELDVARFIPGGKDSMEPVLVTEDGDGQEEYEQEVNNSAIAQEAENVSVSTEEGGKESHQPTLLSHAAISSLIQSSVPITTESAEKPNGEHVDPTVAEMEIWESESAAEEAAAAADDQKTEMDAPCAGGVLVDN